MAEGHENPRIGAESVCARGKHFFFFFLPEMMVLSIFSPPFIFIAVISGDQIEKHNEIGVCSGMIDAPLPQR